METDFIIVGQGLAGTLLAFELFRQNKRFVVFDGPNLPQASEVAAGLINPVVFRRMTKSWLVDDAFPRMENTYRQLEQLLQERFYFPQQMLKILSAEGVGLWKQKALANELEAYLIPDPQITNRINGIEGPLDMGCVTQSGRLDIQKLILSFASFLDQQNWVRKEEFDCIKLVLGPKEVEYQDITASKVIFCEGPAASVNPFFKNLKFKHSKGEILELEIQELMLHEIINSEVFVMPVENGRYKVGATYSWNELNWEVTATAREELLEKLRHITSSHVNVLSQKAGIRPTMHDRKPAIGLLPDRPQIGIFNGLGSKGVLLAPYFAHQLANFLTGVSGYIHPEATVQRYFTKK